MDISDRIFEQIMKDQFHRRILENNLRGVFAEYLVAELLGAGWSVTSGSWNEWDIDGPNGEKLEVKCSSYLQTWTEEMLKRPGFRSSQPGFGIAEHTRDYWSKPLPKPIRPAHAYVFALHAEEDFAAVDQRRPEQWRFFVIASDKQPDGQKRISLGPLSRLAEPVSANELKEEVVRVLEGAHR